MERNRKVEPLVTVIIPIHDRFALVNETITSVIDQTYRPIELIVVDDYSNEIYKPFVTSKPDFRVIVLRHGDNRGPGAARETGRQAASGEFIAYLDSDDLWHPSFLDKLVEMLKRNTEIGMCYCKTAQFNGKNRETTILRRRNDQKFISIIPTLFFGRPWSTAACLWTKRATNIIGPWFEGWTNEDIEYDLRAGVLGIKIDHINEVLCFERETEDPQQLSHVPNNKAILQKYPAIVQMAKTIIKYKPTLQKDIPNIFLKKFMRPMAAELFNYEEYVKVIEICKLMTLIPESFSRKWLLTIILLFGAVFRKFPGSRQLFLLSCRYLS
jgi:glycosyltransferase involved in cell wall biosynthesis